MNAAKAFRSFASVLAGMFAWAALWIGSNAGLAAALPGSFRDDGSTESTGILLLLLVASVTFSVLAGYVTGALAPTRPLAHGLALGLVQLAIGVAVQAQYWDLMPFWYHLVFLLLLLPGNLLGAWLKRARTGVVDRAGAAPD